MHLSRSGGSNIAAKLNKGVFSETLNSFIALIVNTHATHSGYNFQSCVVAGINSLCQEINKHHTLSDSVNQVVRYWLLPLLTETTEHKNQGNYCNIACPALVSKILKALNTATLLIEMQVPSD